MRTILVVDDEFGIAETLQLLLEDDGYHVTTASNGRQGLQRLADGVPDLVLLDYMMPGLDGPGMLRAIREDLTYRDLPVIMMTALPEAAVADGVGKLGYAAFLRKPFRAQEVLNLVARLLGGNKA
jgi:CheY-like chemotaxis protein